MITDFNDDYKDDMNYSGLDFPKLIESTKSILNIMIDPEMRKFRALMHCFLDAISFNCWDIIDDGTNVIKLKIY